MKTQAEIKQFIVDNLDRHTLFALATIDEQGNPWVVCASLAYDEQFNVIWKSLKNTEHSKHIRARPAVSICIFSDTEAVGNFGLYMKARAREVTDPDELRRLLVVRAARQGKLALAASEFLGDSLARLYYAEATEAWVNSDSHTKQVVDLATLRAHK
jgi:uncharacterized protein YhbP (UPF0306 family)